MRRPRPRELYPRLTQGCDEPALEPSLAGSSVTSLTFTLSKLPQKPPVVPGAEYCGSGSGVLRQVSLDKRIPLF